MSTRTITGTILYTAVSRMARHGTGGGAMDEGVEEFAELIVRER